MAEDPEIDAMSALAEALAPLGEDARARVLDWSAKRYGIAVTRDPDRTQQQSDTSDVPDEVPDEMPDVEPADIEAFKDFADLYDVTDPQSEEDKALVGAYWSQVLQESGSFTAYQANESLRNMGHAVKNITRSLDLLQRSQPALVRQMSKSGKSKQARKIYKLTNSGIKAVEAMLQ